jgi:hypothetical protein
MYYSIFFLININPHDPDGPNGTMHLYNCVYDNEEEKGKKRKEAQSATNTETVLMQVHKSEAARAIVEAFHAHPEVQNLPLRNEICCWTYTNRCGRSS